MENFYQQLRIFLESKCEISPISQIKGVFLYKEFLSFLGNQNKIRTLDIKTFYELMRLWMEKTPENRTMERKFSNTIYFEGISVKGKIDDSKEKYNEYMKNKGKEHRLKNATKEGRIIIPRTGKVKSNIVKLYSIHKSLPEEVVSWNQHEITIYNFNEWYQKFLKNIDKISFSETLEKLTVAYNNLRHAGEIRPKEFRNKDYSILIRHIESKLDFLESNTSTKMNVKIEESPNGTLTDSELEIIYNAMYKTLIEKYPNLLDKWIPISNDDEINSWIETTYPQDQKYYLIRFQLVKDILIDEYSKRNNKIKLPDSALDWDNFIFDINGQVKIEIGKDEFKIWLTELQTRRKDMSTGTFDTEVKEVRRILEKLGYGNELIDLVDKLCETDSGKAPVINIFNIGNLNSDSNPFRQFLSRFSRDHTLLKMWDSTDLEKYLSELLKDYTGDKDKVRNKIINKAKEWGFRP